MALRARMHAGPCARRKGGWDAAINRRKRPGRQATRAEWHGHAARDPRHFKSVAGGSRAAGCGIRGTRQVDGGARLAGAGAAGGTGLRPEQGTRLAGLSPGLLVWLCVVLLALILD